MQLVTMSSSSTSSSSSSGSSRSACGRPDHIKGLEEFQRLHLRSSPPPPGPHRKAMGRHHHRHGHHGGHSAPPHHVHGHSAHKWHHDSFPPPPPLCAPHGEKAKLRVKHPKHCKKVGKLHRKLMKACKPPKGTAHHLHFMHSVCPGARQLPGSFNPADAPHHPAGCCLHNRGLSMMQAEMLAELEQHPPCQEAGVRHHGRHGHPHRHGTHGRHVRSEIRCGSAPPMSPARHEAKDMQAEPASEAGVPPPVSDNMLLAGEGGPAVVLSSNGLFRRLICPKKRVM